MKRGKNGFIISATEDELFGIYIKNNWDDVMDFNDFLSRVAKKGTKVIPNNKQDGFNLLLLAIKGLPVNKRRRAKSKEGKPNKRKEEC